MELWKHVVAEYEETDLNSIVEFVKFANYKQPPTGFYDYDLWDKMDDSQKEMFLRVENKARLDSIYSSQVCKFFCDCSNADFEFDTSVNALALLNGSYQSHQTQADQLLVLYWESSFTSTHNPSPAPTPFLSFFSIPQLSSLRFRTR